MFNLVGKHKGQTAVFVLAGPSAKDIDKRLRPYRHHDNLKVITLNNTGRAVTHPDYYACFETMGDKGKDWYSSIVPGYTSLLTSPIAHGDLARHWGGKNTYYSYMGDLMQPHDARWHQLPLVVSALTTAVPTLQCLHYMGFDNVFIVGGDYSIANVGADPANPSMIAEGDFYWDGTKYYLNPPEANACYYNRDPMTGFIGIGGEVCGSNAMLHMHMCAVRCAMDILESDGIDVRNCSGMGLLEKNVANLEESLEEVL